MFFSRQKLDTIKSPIKINTMKFTLKNKKILIIEDYSVMRRAIKEMLFSLDAQDIHETENGADAISAMEGRQFDMVLCDFNLGKGKNGLHVLEEARYRNLLPYYAVFVMITAEQTPGMVLCAMENKPDEYLTKPFTAQQLLTRLQRNSQKKTYLASVERERANGNLPQAIVNCDKLLESADKKMRSQLLKLRADLAINAGDYLHAKSIYDEVLQQRELNWARLGLGKTIFLLGDQQQAIEIFLKVIEENPMTMEAYDWLGKAYEAIEEHTDAVEIINAAVDLSPQAILRQKKLATIAEKTGKLEIAQDAYKAAIKLGKYSVYKSSSDFTGLAKVYNKSGSAEDALKTLDNLRQAFSNDPETELKASLLETEVYHNMDESKLAEMSFDRARKLTEQLGNQVSKDLRLDMVKACHINNETEEADKILEPLIKNNIDDEAFINEIKDMYESIGLENHAEQLIKQSRKELLDINNKGVSLFKQGKRDDAIKVLEEAIKKMPDNRTINLNMAKILLHDIKVSGYDKDKLKQAGICINRACELGVANDKIGNIKMEYNNLIQARAANQSI